MLEEQRSYAGEKEKTEEMMVHLILNTPAIYTRPGMIQYLTLVA